VDTAKAQDRFRFGDDFELDVRNYQLRRAGRALKLERIPMEILILLARRAGHLVTREEIANHVWGKNVFVDTDNSINSAVRKVRQALRDDPEKPRFLQTVVGRGYVFQSSQLIPFSTADSDLPDAHGAIENIQPGRRVGDYRVIQLIGAGGMGVVYAAEDLNLGRQVAIKFLPSELLNDSKSLERIQREARIASNLNHPNICPIYQLAEFEGQPFIVMPLLDGTTLREWIELQASRSADTCIREILNIAVQIVDGLKAAHAQGIIHRDVKPANIFVTSGNQVKILDFGVAKLLRSADHHESEPAAQAEHGGNSALTLTVPSTGTPSYLSPEQIRGETVDERSDIFSFGAVLYEMCTGHRAFEHDTIDATRNAILTSDSKPIHAWRPELPGRMSDVVRKSMERSPEARYQTAADLKSDLIALKEELNAPFELGRSASLTSASAKAKIWRRAAIGLTAIALVTGAATWLVFTRSPGPQPFRNFTISQITTTGRAQQVAISPDGKYVLHVQDESGLKSLRLRNIETGSDTDVLTPENTRFTSLSFSPDGNYVYFRKLVNSTGSEWDAFRMPVLGGTPVALVRDVDSDFTFSPDGKRISYVRANDPDEGRYRILTANLDGTNETVETIQAMHGSGTDAYPPFNAWSPDGRRILYTFAKLSDEPGVIRAFNLPMRSFETFQHFPDLLTFDIHYMPLGKWLLMVSSPRGGEAAPQQISAFSLVDHSLHSITRDANSYSSLTVSADGKHAAAIQKTSLRSLELMNMNRNSRTQLADSKPANLGNFSSFDWSDERHLLASDGTKLSHIELSSGKTTELFSESQGGIVALAHCSAGAIIINREFRTGMLISEIWKLNEDGSNPTRLSDGEFDTSPACSPDGKWVYYLDGTRQIKRVAIGGRPETISVNIPNLDRILGTFSFSPDASLMAALVEVIDPAMNRAQERFAVFETNAASSSAPRMLVPAVPVDTGSMHSGGVRFSPNGNSLLYVTRRSGAWELWEQPLNGSPGHSLTESSPDAISQFRFSPSGDRLAIDRVHTISDIVVLRDQDSP
jgi:serine/threonine protein kinase/Tol biopolymer transport system component/DNA-binding winged helix-turn-helix (wHTH) protein